MPCLRSYKETLIEADFTFKGGELELENTKGTKGPKRKAQVPIVTIMRATIL